MKQRVVDSVTVEASDLRQVDPGSWTSVLPVRGSDHLQATSSDGEVLEVDSRSLETLMKSAAVFQTCSECKKKIYGFYRSVRHQDVEVAFVSCSCGQFPVVVKSGAVAGRLSIQFDSTRADNEKRSHGYNRSVWSTSTALLYCEKTSRLVVEYQWKDLEAGQFDKHSVKLSGIKSTAKTADIAVEGGVISHLLIDGSVALRGLLSEIAGSL